ncbi:MAG: hypothetical protein ABEK16_00415 [Candidatus Nanohalobium sp.]
MSLENLEEKFQEVSEIDDVGEKRFQMFRIFDQILGELDRDSFKDLQGFDGYLYKLSQDFLTSSSTYEKEQKMEDILARFERKYAD